MLLFSLFLTFQVVPSQAEDAEARQLTDGHGYRSCEAEGGRRATDEQPRALTYADGTSPSPDCSNYQHRLHNTLER